MSDLPNLARLEQYLQRNDLSQHASLGFGKDGSVWLTNTGTAIKIHAIASSYLPERDAYIRLLARGIDHVAGFEIPVLLNFEDDLLALEMTVVSPPFVLDFASARLDSPPDLIEDEGHTLYDLMEDRFGDRASKVMELYEELAAKADLYLLDFHPQNIKFAPSDD
jgi:hypothetical protein